MNRRPILSLFVLALVLVGGAGLWVASRPFALSGWERAGQPGVAVATLTGGSQTVAAAIGPASFPRIIVQRGLPVRLVLLARSEDLSSCNETLVMPGFGLRAKLVAGANRISFIPETSGPVDYACWMGMIRSRIEVVDDLSDRAAIDRLLAEPIASSTGDPKAGPVPLEYVGIAERRGQKQVLRLDYDGLAFRPAILVLRRGVPASISFSEPGGAAAPGSAVVFPGHDQRIVLGARARVASFSEPVADFTFRIEGGGAEGYVKVVDDPGAIDLAALRSEVAAYRPAAEALASCCGY